MSNPLTTNTALPNFADIRVEHFEPAIEQIIEENRQQVKRVVSAGDYSWQGLAAPLEEAGDTLNNAFSVLSHYNGVLNNDELREIYKRLIASLTAFSTEIGQNKELYAAYEQLAQSEEYKTLDEAKCKVIDNEIRDFKLAGVALEYDDKATYSQLRQDLSALTNDFSEKVLDATEGWTKYFESAEQLPGLPDSALDLLASLAKEKGHESGYLLTLDFPSYMPVITYCENRELRKEVYTAYVTRASDQGPDAGKWDNSENIQAILTKRKALAGLLGFKNYAEYSLATKMAGSVDEVVTFLQELAEKSKPHAMQELAELNAFAKDNGHDGELEMWDVPFYSEKLRLHSFDISQEALRPYFPAPVVTKGMFDVVARLYGIDIKERDDIETYYKDAKYFELSQDGTPFAGFYLDLYARTGKRGGAWMSDCRVRRINQDGELQLPVAFLTCNFTPPVDGKPSLLTHNEVTTLFHEFGHGLHHMLTQVDVAAVSGISGVAWDVVELPSQFFENWCWHKESIAMISAHHETGEPLPDDMLDKLLAAKHFQSGMLMLRQIEFALFDFLLHRDFEEGVTDVLALAEDVRDQVAVLKPPAFSRFSHSFSHIFAGGYAAGYYSYKWAEVLAADAFSRFEEEGIFDRKAGRDFKEQILEVGGSKDAMDMFVAFRGRKPSVEPLLKQSGLVA